MTSDSGIHGTNGRGEVSPHALQGRSRQQVDQLTNDMRSDGLSNAAFDMISQSLKNTQLTGLGGEVSSLSKASRVKRYIVNLLKQLMERIKEEQDETEVCATTTNNNNAAATNAANAAVQAEIVAPQSVPSLNFFQPNQQLENFLLEKLSE